MSTNEQKLQALKFAYQILTDKRSSERYALSFFKSKSTGHYMYYGEMLDALNEIAQGMMDGGLTTKTVPVTHCKDCWRRGKKGVCPLMRPVANPTIRELKEYIDYSEDDGFCHYANRKPDAGPETKGRC